MMSVNGPRITGRQSLMMRMLTLSGPGVLLEGIDDTICSTSVKVTGVKLNSSSNEFLVVRGEIRLVSEYAVVYGQLCSSLSCISANKGEKLVEIVSNLSSVSLL